MLKDFDGCPEGLEPLDHYGVNRARPDFREVYDRFQRAFDAVNPVQAGLFDLNRYFYLARTQEQQGDTLCPTRGYHSSNGGRSAG